MSALDRSLSHDEPVLRLVSGEAGVGKTRLVAELATRAARRGFTVLYGRCSPLPVAPYEPFVEALREASAARPLSELSDATRGEAQGHADVEQLRLLDALTEALDAPRRGGPGLLVLEDLQWAEPSTLTLLSHLAGGSGIHGLTLLATAREPDPDHGAALAPALVTIGRRASVEPTRLEGLDAAEIRQLVSGWAGRPASSRLASDLRAHTGGNPFMLHATLAHLDAIGLLRDEQGRLTEALPAAAREAVAIDVIELVDSRVAALGPSAGELLRAGALLGADFALDEARLAVGLELADAVEAAEAATAAGLVRPVSGTRVRLHFDHSLVRYALAERMSPSRRALLHLRLGEAIEHRGDDEGRVGELALHFGEASSVGGAERALVYARRAAGRASRQFAFAEAAVQLERALDAAAGRDWQERYELLIDLGTARYRVDGPAAAHPAFEQAADVAERHGDAERLARAGLGVGLERYLRHVGLDAPALDLLDRALSALDPSDSVLRVRLLSARLLERCFVDPLDERERDSSAAVAMAERIGDPGAEAVARVARQVALWHPRHTEQLLEEVPRVVELTRLEERPDLAMQVHCSAFGYALELGRRAVLDAQLDAARGVAEALRAPMHTTRAQALVITRALVLGQFDAARREISDVWALLEPLNDPLAEPLRMQWAFVLEREQGDLGPLRAPLDAAVAAAPGALPARALLAEICARTGDLAAARAHLDVLGAHEFADVHEDFLWLSVLAMSATVAVLVDDRPRAALLYELLAPHAGRNVVAGLATADRPVSHALGLLARALGRGDAALEHFERAAADAQAFGALPWRAQALAELGATQRRLGHRHEAHDPLLEARDLAERLGARPLSRHVADELRAIGARPRRVRLTGPKALSPRELQVAELAAAGHSNDAIARRLVVSRRTVETHLTSAYRKLGVAGRAGLDMALSPAGDDV